MSKREAVGRIHSLETFGAVDGPGVRYVVFFQGCPLRCVFCHNPDSWDAMGGTKKTAGELADEIIKYRSFIKRGGVTLSGGEPLLQADFAQALLELCHAEGLHTAIDTSGCIPLSKCKGAVDAADLLLLDIKSIDATLAKEISGADTSNAIELLNYCEKTKKPVWIRHVLVPSLTLNFEQAKRMGAFLQGYNCIEKVELLPFHKFGEYKWEVLGLHYTLADTEPPLAQDVEAVKQILEGCGLKVQTAM